MSGSVLVGSMASGGVAGIHGRAATVEARFPRGRMAHGEAEHASARKRRSHGPRMAAWVQPGCRRCSNGAGRG